RSCNDHFWAETKGSEFLYRVLGRLGFLFTLKVFHNQGHMNKHNIFGRLFPVHLAYSLKERHALNVPNCASYFNKTDISPAAGCNLPDPAFDLICDMRNNLDSFSEIVPSSLFGNYF